MCRQIGNSFLLPTPHNRPQVKVKSEDGIVALGKKVSRLSEPIK